MQSTKKAFEDISTKLRNELIAFENTKVQHTFVRACVYLYLCVCIDGRTERFV